MCGMCNVIFHVECRVLLLVLSEVSVVVYIIIIIIIIIIFILVVMQGILQLYIWNHPCF
jgi:hypothetical protein